MRPPQWSLTAKMAAATALAVALTMALAFLPQSCARREARRREVLFSMASLAEMDAALKAKALATGDFSSVKKRLPLWPAERYQAAMALVDRAGKVKVSSGAPPSLEQGKGQELLQKALSGKTVRSPLGRHLTAICPLGPAGELKGGEQPLGAFLAAADEGRALAAAGGGRGGAGWLAIALSLIAATALIGGANYLVILRPIRRLAERIGQTDVEAGRFPPPAAPAAAGAVGADDLGRIAQTLDLLVQRVQEHQALARQAGSLLDGAEAGRRALADLTDEILWRVDAQGRFLFISGAIEGLLGVAPQELYDSADPLLDLIHSEDQEMVRAALAPPAPGKALSPIEFRATPRGAPGDTRYFSLTRRAAVNRDGKGLANVQPVCEGRMRDVTQLKRMEQELEERRLRFDALHNLSRARRGNLTRRELFDLFACQSAELLGMERAIVARVAGMAYRVAGLYNFPDDAARSGHPLANTPLERIIRTGLPLALLEGQSWAAYGLEAPFVGAPVFDLGGNVTGAICCYGATRDATEENIGAVALFAELLTPHLLPLAGDPPEQG